MLNFLSQNPMLSITCKNKGSFPSKGVYGSCKCPASWRCPFLCHTCTNFQSICGPSSPLSIGSVSCWQVESFCDFFRFSLSVLQSLMLTHTPFLSWRAQLPACALALAPMIRPPMSDMEAKEVEVTQISGNVRPQLVLFALGTFFVISIAQVPHSTSSEYGSIESACAS